MFKKILKITAVSLGLLATGAFAQQESAGLDVIIRDFPASAPGFQEAAFCDTYNGKGNINGNNAARGNINVGTGAAALDIDVDKKGRNGNATLNMVLPELRYDAAGCDKDLVMGEVGDPDYIRYRYCAYPQAGPASCAFSQQWVESWFDETKPYNTMGDKAKGKIVDVMTLNLNPLSKLYEISHTDVGPRPGATGADGLPDNGVNGPVQEVNWNGFGATGGYFPLDKYSVDPAFANLPDDNGVPNGAKVFGLENCSCNNVDPNNNQPYNWGLDCNGLAWNAGVADLDGDGYADNWAQPSNSTNNWGAMCAGTKYAHNYGFSMAGSGTFKYIAGSGDQFEFIGDDDMWIFIDGILTADIGGIHQAVKHTIIMDELAGQRGWESGSIHSINFFYMDRQTTGSNMVLKMSLTDLSPPRFGSPKILKATTTIEDNKDGKTTIYVSSDLNLESVKQHIGTGTFPILVHKPGSMVLLGYNLKKIEYIGSAGSEGFTYLIEGAVCADKACTQTQVLNTGDSLSFNVKSGDMELFQDPAEFTFTDDSQFIRSKGNVPSNKLNWAKNTSTIIIPPPTPEPGDPDPLKPDFDMDTWFSGNGPIGTFSPSASIPNLPTSPGHGINKGNVSGFGTKGTTVPANKAGEMLLTVYPNTGRSDGGKVEEKMFGLPPKSSGGNPFGLADPTKMEDAGGGYMFVKNGFKDESSVGAVQIAPTRCTRQTDDPKEPKINCLNFSTMVKQPFKMAVTVYDQLGNFVTQYREEITADEFRRVVQAPGFYPNYGEEDNPKVSTAEGCVEPNPNELDPKKPGAFGHPQTLTTNGKVKASVNIYPFSADGRRFGNGVYLLKIDRVDMPYDGCMSSGGSAVSTTNIFVRMHSDEKFGYMRSKDKK